MGYQKLKQEQMLLLRRIETLKEKEIPVIAGKVKASSREFPYTERRVSVQMEDPVISERVRRLLFLYKERQKKLGEQMLEIEEFINEIADPQIRQIFEMRFMEGQKQEEIAQRLHLERSSVSKKITAYLQLSHKSQKNVI